MCNYFGFISYSLSFEKKQETIKTKFSTVTLFLSEMSLVVISTNILFNSDTTQAF